MPLLTVSADRPVADAACMAESQYYHWRYDVENRDHALRVIETVDNMFVQRFNGSRVMFAAYEVSADVGKSHVHTVLEVFRVKGQKSRTPLVRALGIVGLRPEEPHKSFLSTPLSPVHLVNTIVYETKDDDVLVNRTGIDVDALKAFRTGSRRKAIAKLDDKSLLDKIEHAVREKLVAYADEHGMTADYESTIMITQIEADAELHKCGRRLMSEYNNEGLLRTVLYRIHPKAVSMAMYERMKDRLMGRK